MVAQLSADVGVRQDVRIAVVLNGGVSLAVWIGGVVNELHQLVQAGRAPESERGGDVYAELLDLLGATVRIDVIAGTSAGGLNGGFLALGLVHGCDLSTMRELWEDDGGLAELLRDPRQKSSPSLLRGEYFYDRIREAYRTVWGGPRGRAGLAEPVELLLTGTLWNGRRSPFTDDTGRTITEVDYDATFRFTSTPEEGGDVDDQAPVAGGDLRHERVTEELAVASRCTSSFPCAFEPYRVTVDSGRPQAGDRWPTTGGLANFDETQYVVDGGVLLNKPIRPAIDAIYRQAASSQVRRILAYVVPDPGEGPEPAPADTTTASVPAARNTTPPKPPGAQQVVLGVLTRLRSTDSVSKELGEIGQRNETAQRRRRTRDRFATALATVSAPATSQDGGRARTSNDLPGAAWESYREVRAEHAARTVGNLLVSGQVTDGSRWSPREVADGLRRIAAAEGLPFVPSGTLDDALARDPSSWDWGQTTVHRLSEMTIDVLKRAMWLLPIGSPHRRSLAACRREVHEVLAAVRADRQALDRFWRRSGSQLPPRGSGAAATPAELETLDTWLRPVLTGWEGDDPERRRAELHDQALALGTRLFEYREALRASATLSQSPVDPGGGEIQRLRALVETLLNQATAPADVLRSMLRLDVVQVAFAGTTEEVEQEVELVQVSSLSRDLLTGVQEHHFGAFYRRSWRTNDWLHGRLDGAEQLVQVLLAPERLRQREFDASSAFEKIHQLAVGPAHDPDHDALEAEWVAYADRVQAELDCLNTTTPLPRTLPISAARVAKRLHIRILRTELPALAKSIDVEPDPLPASDRWAQQIKEATGQQDLNAAALQQLYESSKTIGRQRIRQELAIGTDTFAKTVTHASVALTSTIGTVKPKVVATVLSALRGYALMLWALVNFSTQRGHFGANVVNLIVGVGAALLAVTFVVPGIPVGVTLAGVLLILAAASAAALVERETRRSVGVRLIVAALVAAAALVATVAWNLLADDDTQTQSTMLPALGKIATVAAVIALGWWVARARPNGLGDRHRG